MKILSREGLYFLMYLSDELCVIYRVFPFVLYKEYMSMVNADAKITSSVNLKMQINEWQNDAGMLMNKTHFRRISSLSLDLADRVIFRSFLPLEFEDSRQKAGVSVVNSIRMRVSVPQLHSKTERHAEQAFQCRLYRIQPRAVGERKLEPKWRLPSTSGRQRLKVSRYAKRARLCRFRTLLGRIGKSDRTVP